MQLVSYNGILSSLPPRHTGFDWTKRPNPDSLTFLTHIVRTAKEPITERNFRRWLVELALDKVPDGGASCPNGDDHACNRGLAMFLEMQPYGQTSLGHDRSGDGFLQFPWNQQKGYSCERLNRHVDPAWKDALLAADFTLQRVMYSSLIETLRDRGEFVYTIPKIADITVEQALTADRMDRELYGSDIVDGLSANA